MKVSGLCLVGVLASFKQLNASNVIKVLATSPYVKWVGRVQPDVTPGSVYMDWEGVSATITVSGYSYVAVSINDQCGGSSVGGGSRWSVSMTTTNANIAAEDHRISTFWSGSLQPLYYMFNNPGENCDPACAFTGNTTFTLTRLTESRLSGCAISGGNLSVAYFQTDGTVVPNPTPAAPVRRLEFIGDSITAGDLNDGSGLSECANAAYNDDITFSSGANLCKPVDQGGFGADCMYTAWGGIKLGAADQGWGMSELYPFTFSSTGTNAYGAWNFTSFPVDAVVINLGTNDRPAAPATVWQQSYVQFVTDLVTKYYDDPTIQVFLAYGPMTTEYQPFVTNVTATLVSSGINAHLLDLTLTHAMTGCYGHPSAADNVEIAAKARPQIAAVMGWQ